MRPADLVGVAAVASAHSVITYPGWRGNNLVTNSSFPYGMQWMYPCGGISTTQNRTYWPTTGGALAFQPGWFRGHATASLYVNLGLGTDGPDGGPPNMSNPMVHPFQLLGPTNNPYPGTVCLPQVPLPANSSIKAGDKATIQLVELAQHGAALYSCVDIIFAEPGDSRIAEVNETNCFNSSELGFADLYTITTKDAHIDGQRKSDAVAVGPVPWLWMLAVVAAGTWAVA
ncbi:GPI anchored protein [Ophiocordyceps camponoti-floridani]|uniref:GPI anchored protein n=1 Tax=Ophiocordyceps camponoti-floridani TaxID=2030778 RepID=A0A8H4Q756_9HYPO|nr:GPI anchored protein [Ophiocordyceps camponoti-floridani]